MNLKLLPLILVTLFFAIGVVDDLRSRKVHNELILGFTAISIVTALVMGGGSGFAQGLFALGLAATLMIPLFLMNVLGGGDVKLMLAASILMTTTQVLETTIFSIMWGAVLGLSMAVTHGNLKNLLKSTVRVASRQAPEAKTLHRMPFTVALIFGWLSQITYGGLFT